MSEMKRKGIVVVALALVLSTVFIMVSSDCKASDGASPTLYVKIYQILKIDGDDIYGGMDWYYKIQVMSGGENFSIINHCNDDTDNPIVNKTHSFTIGDTTAEIHIKLMEDDGWLADDLFDISGHVGGGKKDDITDRRGAIYVGHYNLENNSLWGDKTSLVMVYGLHIYSYTSGEMPPDSSNTTDECDAAILFQVGDNYDPPIADAGPDKTVYTDEKVTFDGSGSTASPGSSLENFEWDFEDDGEWDVEGVIKTTTDYSDKGDYTVRLRVTDSLGVTDNDTCIVHVLNSPPEANFSYSPTNPLTGVSIHFTDLSYDPDGIIVNKLWEFGDGDTSTAQNPSHSYADDGDYMVNLTVTDNDGDNTTNSTTISVGNRNPTANFTFQPIEPTTAETINFHDESFDVDGEIDYWLWDFGDNYTSTTQNPEHQYTDDGTYSVTLNVTDDDGDTDIITKVINVTNQPPVANFTSRVDGKNLSVYVNASQSLDHDGDITNYSWDWTNNGVWDEYGMIANHTYSSYGEYSIRLRVRDDDGDENTTTKSIVINAPPTANFTWTPKGGIRPQTNEAITFDASASNDPDGTIAFYKWDWNNDGTFDESKIISTTTHSWSDDGDYNVTLQVTDNYGANDTISKSVAVHNRAPSASFSFAPWKPETGDHVSFMSSCSDADGYIQSYSWSFGDGESSSQTNPRHTYTQSGVYTITLTIVDDDGAVSSTSRNINVNSPPVADFTYTPVHPTDMDNIHFTDSSTDNDGNVVNRTWDFGDGNFSYEQNPSHQYSNNGNYTVTLTVKDNDGATDIKSEGVTVENIEPTANFTYTPKSPVKIDTTLNFTDNSIDPDGTIVNWMWDFGDGTKAYGNQVSHIYNESGDYNITLTVTDDDGDNDSYIMSIEVKEKEEEGGIPGFEFAFLIIAIATIIIFKRKKDEK